MKTEKLFRGAALALRLGFSLLLLILSTPGKAENQAEIFFNRSAAPKVISTSPNGLFQITALFNTVDEDKYKGGIPVLRSLNWSVSSQGKLHPFAGLTKLHVGQSADRMYSETKWSPDSRVVAVSLGHHHFGILDILVRSPKGNAFEMLEAWNKFDVRKEIKRFAAKQVPPETARSYHVSRLWLSPLEVRKDEVLIEFSGDTDVTQNFSFNLF